MGIKTWNAEYLTGGATRALDAIATSSLTDKDRSFVATTNILYYYKFDAAATDAESSPDIIRPDDYTTAGVWKLQQIYGQRQNLSSSITITVGAGGDYATINEAIEVAYNTYAPTHDSNEVSITISLLTGFVMAEQVFVFGLDMGWINITGVDAETTITRSALTEVFYGQLFLYPAFGVTNGGTLPKISQLFRMDATGSGAGRSGVAVYGASTVIFHSSGAPGVADAGGSGVQVEENSRAIISGCDFSGAGANGIYASFASSVYASSCDVSGATTYGINCLSSFVDARSADATSAGTTGIYVEKGGTISADSATGTLSKTANTITADGIIYQ